MRRSHRLIFCLCVLAVSSAALWAPATESGDGGWVTLEDPVRLSVRLSDGTRAGGWVVAYDDTRFELSGPRGSVQAIRWERLSPAEAYRVRRRLLDPADGRGLLRLGRLMLARAGGQ